MAVVAGIDVGKANLDVSISEGPVFRFENTAKGIAKLLKHLKEQDTTMAVCGFAPKVPPEPKVAGLNQKSDCSES